MAEQPSQQGTPSTNTQTPRIKRDPAWVRWLVGTFVVLVLFGQQYIAPRWHLNVGPALRELATLVIAFGVIEHWWKGEISWARVRGPLVLAFLLFALGNMIDGAYNSEGTSHGSPRLAPLSSADAGTPEAGR